jgi:hypothetical protein
MKTIINVEINENKLIKSDKMSMLKLVRINPNGEYGNWIIEMGLSDNQRIAIEKILGIALDDYQFKI